MHVPSRLLVFLSVIWALPRDGSQMSGGLNDMVVSSALARGAPGETDVSPVLGRRPIGALIYPLHHQRSVLTRLIEGGARWTSRP